MADTGGAIRVEAAERKLSATGGRRAKRAADTDPEALEYDAAQPEGAAVSQEDTQMTPPEIMLMEACSTAGRSKWQCTRQSW